MRIYVFGNPSIPGDNLAVLLKRDLEEIFPQISFVEVDPNEDFPPPGVTDPVIIDTVINITKITHLDFSDLKNIDKSPVSPHDYDLLFHLLLLKKSGKLNTVRIIGIPYGTTAENCIHDLEKVISSLLSGNGRRKTYRGQKRG